MLGHALRFLLLVSAVAIAHDAAAQDNALALRALKSASEHFRDELGVRGTFVWRYALDGRERQAGGGAVAPTVGWVQPPGTPAVGAAFLRVHEATGEREWLDAARAVARALVETQLLSGGWYFALETDPQLARSWCYRALGTELEACRRNKGNRLRNRTVLGHNNTASALRFLIWFDQASGRADPTVREAVEFGLRRLLEVQYENGAFPTFFSETAPGADVDVANRASIPASWEPTWQKPGTPPYFIINDDLPRDTGRLLLFAYNVYHDPAYLKAAMRLGDFLVAAQLPRDQQGWAQQYDRSLQPVWGRKFEPPAVASRETAGSIDYLLELHEHTSKVRYLDVAKSAAEWLKASRLPDGAWARFYELNSNRPLYVNDQEEVTFDDDHLLKNYALKGEFDIPAVLARLERAAQGKSVAPSSFWLNSADDLEPSELAARAERLIATQDAQGRWTDGAWVESARFVDAVFVLARFATLENERRQ